MRRLLPPPQAECLVLWLNSTMSPGVDSIATAGTSLPCRPHTSRLRFCAEIGTTACRASLNASPWLKLPGINRRQPESRVTGSR